MLCKLKWDPTSKLYKGILLKTPHLMDFINMFDSCFFFFFNSTIHKKYCNKIVLQTVCQRGWWCIVYFYGREYYPHFTTAKTKSQVTWLVGVWAGTRLQGFIICRIQSISNIYSHDPFLLQISWDAEKAMKKSPQADLWHGYKNMLELWVFLIRNRWWLLFLLLALP